MRFALPKFPRRRFRPQLVQQKTLDYIYGQDNFNQGSFTDQRLSNQCLLLVP